MNLMKIGTDAAAVPRYLMKTGIDAAAVLVILAESHNAVFPLDEPPHLPGKNFDQTRYDPVTLGLMLQKAIALLSMRITGR